VSVIALTQTGTWHLPLVAAAHFCAVATPISTRQCRESPITFIGELKKQVRNCLVLLGEGQSAISDRAGVPRGRQFTHGRTLPRRVQIALKPAAKVLGMHRIFVGGKGRKHVIADSALKRMQVHARSRRLNADQHHLGFALRTGGALKRSRWNGGRQALGLGHGASLHKKGGSTTLSVTGIARGADRRWNKHTPQGTQARVNSGPLAPIALQEEKTAARHTLGGSGGN
jgi:hypothetical protein